jgi:hypothetical protein
VPFLARADARHALFELARPDTTGPTSVEGILEAPVQDALADPRRVSVNASPLSVS